MVRSWTEAPEEIRDLARREQGLPPEDPKYGEYSEFEDDSIVDRAAEKIVETLAPVTEVFVKAPDARLFFYGAATATGIYTLALLMLALVLHFAK